MTTRQSYIALHWLWVGKAGTGRTLRKSRVVYAGETGIQRPAIPAEVLVVPVVQGTTFVLEEYGAVIGVHRRVDRAGGDGIDPYPHCRHILRGSTRGTWK